MRIGRWILPTALTLGAAQGAAQEPTGDATGPTVPANRTLRVLPNDSAARLWAVSGDAAFALAGPVVVGALPYRAWHERRRAPAGRPFTPHTPVGQ